MMRKQFALCGMVVALGPVAFGQAPIPCSNASLKGDYGYVISGVRPTTAGGPLEQMIGSLIRTFDGTGNFTQIDNVHGAISGWVADRPGKGTYTVKADCTGVVKLEVPGVPFQPEERFVLVADGNTLIGASVAPPPLLVTHTAQKVSTGQVAQQQVLAAEIAQMQKTLDRIARTLGLVSEPAQ